LTWLVVEAEALAFHLDDPPFCFCLPGNVLDEGQLGDIYRENAGLGELALADVLVEVR